MNNPDDPETVEQRVRTIKGAAEVIDYFGCWPDFHDADVPQAKLDRGGPSEMQTPTLLRGMTIHLG